MTQNRLHCNPATRDRCGVEQFRDFLVAMLAGEPHRKFESSESRLERRGGGNAFGILVVRRLNVSTAFIRTYSHSRCLLSCEWIHPPPEFS
jgi:hypothetical protein